MARLETTLNPNEYVSLQMPEISFKANETFQFLHFAFKPKVIFVFLLFLFVALFFAFKFLLLMNFLRKSQLKQKFYAAAISHYR